jgi:hypothetical protein
VSGNVISRPWNYLKVTGKVNKKRAQATPPLFYVCMFKEQYRRADQALLFYTL